jgi:hypothetical protein
MTPEVLLSTEDLLVIGPPSEITVDLDIGAKGQRGSQIFLDMGKPSEVFEGTPLPYDLYFNLNPLDSEYLNVYQYISVPVVGGSWVKVFKIFPNELRKNYSLDFNDGTAIKVINVTDILPLSLVSTVDAENFNIVYSIENQNPVASSIDSVSVVVDEETEFINLEITIKALEYKNNAWIPLGSSEGDTGTRTTHLDIRVV